MLELYCTCRKVASSAFLKDILREKNIVAPVLRTENGKPFLAGDPLFFSLSHSGALTAVALSDKAVGLDVEDVLGKKPHAAILRRLSPAEREEIAGESDFLRHWTAKESYVKFCGETLGKLYKKLSFVGGKLRLNGEVLSVPLRFGTLYGDGYIFCLCGGTAEKIVCKQR